MRETDRGMITATQVIEIGVSCNISLEAMAHEIEMRRASRMQSQTAGAEDEQVFEIWRPIFQELFSFAPDFSLIKIPQAQGNLVLPVLMPQELTRRKLGFQERIFGACKELFPSWKGVDSLDESVTHNDRTPKDGSYAVRVGNHFEATDGDEALKGLSAQAIWQRHIATITLAERMMLELYKFRTVQKHLDKYNRTLCSGSRDSDGFVPFADWGGGGFDVYWCRPWVIDGGLRSRVVVF